MKRLFSTLIVFLTLAFTGHLSALPSGDGTKILTSAYFSGDSTSMAYDADYNATAVSNGDNTVLLDGPGLYNMGGGGGPLTIVIAANNTSTASFVLDALDFSYTPGGFPYSVTLTGLDVYGSNHVDFFSVTAANSKTIDASMLNHGVRLKQFTLSVTGPLVSNFNVYSFTASSSVAPGLTPTVTGVSPTSGGSVGGTSVIITGSNFTGSTTVKFGSTSAASFTINTSTQITVPSPAHAAGIVDITVLNPYGVSATSVADQFTYQPSPTISSISPVAGPTSGGTIVTISGTNLTGATAVNFGATNAASFTVNSATSITATAPAGVVGTVDVTATTPVGTSATSASDEFTFVAAPTVTGVSPNSGPTGGTTSVVITGTNLSGATAVKFGATNASGYTINSATQITATSPAGAAGTVDITVTTAGGTSATSASDQFTYVAAPTVTSISPTSGPTGGTTSVVITGTNLSGATAVKFGATNASGYTVNSATQITATSPAGSAGTVDITVTTVGGTSATSASDQFTYVAAPTVTAISPTAGPTAGGVPITITGTNLSGATAVKFGATNASGYTVNSATQITATAPAGSAGTVDITVTTIGGTSATSASDQFTYVAPPTVTAVSPSSGPTGGTTTVVITGTNLSTATFVKFGATNAASFTVDSATQITATSPAGSAGTVDITVTTTGGGTSATSASDQFTYVAAPTVTGISPSSGPTGGTTSVVITGTNLSGTTAVKFGATNASGYTVNSSTQITATAPAGSAGTVDITVTTVGGTSATSASDQYTYVAAPTVTNISPSSGPTGGSTSVVITGTNLSGATAVKFGATNASGYTVDSATQITATSPAGSAGTVDITVTTVGGTSATSASDQFTYVAAPTVTSISPTGGPLAGGTSVVLTGTSLTGATAVKFGATNAASFTVNSATSITATSPAGAAGTVNITVTTVGGTSATAAGNQFSYLIAPVINSALTASGSYGLPISTYTITATSSPTSYGATGLPPGLSVNTASGQITGTPTAAGSFSTTISATSSGNTGTATLVFTIARAPLTITADSLSRYYGVANPALSASYSGFRNSDTAASLSSLPSLYCDALSTSDAGTYPIVASDAVSPNYDFSYVPGVMTVKQLPQTITFTAPGEQPSSAAPFNLVASASSGLPVSFSVVSGPALLVGNQITLSGAPGAVTVRASQAGDKNHEAAPSVDRSFNVVAIQQLVYMGTIQSGSLSEPIAAFYNSQTRKGTLVGRIPGVRESFTFSFTVALNGTWSSQIISTPTYPTLQGGQHTFTGLLSGSSLSGSIEGSGISFTLTQDPLTGPSAAYAGYYHASRLQSSQGTLDLVVGTQGEAFALLNTEDLLANFALTIDSAGSLHVEIPYMIPGSVDSRSILATPITVDLHGTIDPTTTSIRAFTHVVGYPLHTYAGLSSTTQRTDRLSNLSTLGQVSTGSNVTLITGFVISGPIAKPVLLRAIGPSLTDFGITNALATPRLRVVQNGVLIKEVTGWKPELAAEFTRLGAFSLKPGSADTAVELTLDPGVYTMQVLDGDASGSALAEIYDASLNPQADYQRLVNISSRGSITSSAQQLTGGFVFGGNSPKKILVRAVGPGLSAYGVSGVLADPVLKLYNANSTAIAGNDNWETPAPIDISQVAATAAELSAACTATGAFPLVAGSKDASLLITLEPGVYTATVTSASGGTGVALIEIYEVP